MMIHVFIYTEMQEYCVGREVCVTVYSAYIHICRCLGTKRYAYVSSFHSPLKLFVDSGDNHNTCCVADVGDVDVDEERKDIDNSVCKCGGLMLFSLKPSGPRPES